MLACKRRQVDGRTEAHNIHRASTASHGKNPKLANLISHHRRAVVVLCSTVWSYIYDARVVTASGVLTQGHRVNRYTCIFSVP